LLLLFPLRSFWFNALVDGSHGLGGRQAARHRHHCLGSLQRWWVSVLSEFPSRVLNSGTQGYEMFDEAFGRADIYI